jgi:hypothetical protein
VDWASFSGSAGLAAKGAPFETLGVALLATLCGSPRIFAIQPFSWRRAGLRVRSAKSRSGARRAIHPPSPVHGGNGEFKVFGRAVKVTDRDGWRQTRGGRCRAGRLSCT